MSFLRNYQKFTSGNEAHPVYHHYCGLVALSSIVSRRVWIDLGYFNIYPNLYVVLVGPAGNRKTTAMSTTKKLLRELQEIPFSAECQTKESLVRELSENTRNFKLSSDSALMVYHPMTICVTELSQFLGINSAHMVDFLVTVYDQDFYDVKTKNKGNDTIIGPYITLLACTTPSWITTYLRHDVISGGFSRRCIFVYETEKTDRIAFPKITPEMDIAWKDLLKRSRQLLKIGGPFTWDSDSKKWYENWYVNLKIPQSEVMARFYESKHVQMLKMAMLIALSESDDLIMRIEYMETALAMLDLVEQNLERVFSGMGRNELNNVCAKVIELLHGMPQKCIPEKLLKKQMFSEANSNEIYEIIKHLTTTEEVDRVVVKRNGQPVVYLGLRNLWNPKKLES
jgi:hypothetical protein